MGNSFVYLLRAGGFSKIGKANDVIARVAQLATACPYPIQVVMTTQFDSETAAYNAERELHEQWQCRKTSGEWFHSHPEIDQSVAALGDEQFSLPRDKMARLIGVFVGMSMPDIEFETPSPHQIQDSWGIMAPPSYTLDDGSELGYIAELNDDWNPCGFYMRDSDRTVITMFSGDGVTILRSRNERFQLLYERPDVWHWEAQKLLDGFLHRSGPEIRLAGDVLDVFESVFGPHEKTFTQSQRLARTAIDTLRGHGFLVYEEFTGCDCPVSFWPSAAPKLVLEDRGPS